MCALTLGDRSHLVIRRVGVHVSRSAQGMRRAVRVCVVDHGASLVLWLQDVRPDGAQPVHLHAGVDYLLLRGAAAPHSPHHPPLHLHAAHVYLDSNVFGATGGAQGFD